ncbi:MULTISPECIES: hypothetical protein [unclassified Pseudomonas]|uniref:hypothetical protein n=1 Tax=unclassified Pseudomonas TaxID=196821 RepID=UPI00244AFB0B|nr:MULTISPECIES: hypothetical protein [unclassified Pseudomonas]MDH0302742.1 hypothetical protein [Pseudomonas sp. GD04091]MDH1984445.1 hypothetical protein [Pseudomonas sp. GD03689]
MRYVQERSFLATLTSVTPGYEGPLDSVEGVPLERRNNWLTIAPPGSVETQQRFWFGYFQGSDAGYQIRTVESGPGGSHYAIWDLNIGNAIGFYLKSKKPILWRVRVDDAKLQRPELRTYGNVTLAAPSRAMVGVANRSPWDDHYVGVNRPNLLHLRMEVLQVDCQVFDAYDQFRRR